MHRATSNLQQILLDSKLLSEHISPRIGGWLVLNNEENETPRGMERRAMHIFDIMLLAWGEGPFTTLDSTNCPPTVTVRARECAGWARPDGGP